MTKKSKGFLTAVLVLASIIVIASAIYAYYGFGFATPPITNANNANNNNQGQQILNFADCVAAGNPVQESYPRRCTGQGVTFTEDIGNELEKADLIRIASPRPNQTVTSPLAITGEARNWYFEATFPIKILDSQGSVLAQWYAQADGEWMTENFVPFTGELNFIVPQGETHGTLVLAKSNASGLPEHDDELIVPVQFGNNPEMTSVKIYLLPENAGGAPNFNCAEVEERERLVPRTAAIAHTAVSELLKGPTGAEVGLGFTTALNYGVDIQRLVIENGVAEVDFSVQLGAGVGGSCRVTAIRAQIENTLRQFPSVQSVVISINGETEEILQP